MTRDTLDAEAQAFLCDEARLQRFQDGLRCGDRRTVRDTEVWIAFTAAYSDLPSGPERRLWLLAALEELAARGAIQLPVRHGKQWDRTSEIVLPTAVSLASTVADGSARIRWRQFPWHPQLQWVFQLRTLVADQISFLMRVNEGLVEGWFAQPECFKYRSLQLTGDEKRLETLRKGTLFGPGRLTLEMLGCQPEALPLAMEHLSSEPTMLIFENAAPFMLARTLASGTVHPRVGRLAYGAGKQVLKAVDCFSMIQPAITEILYVGDLDGEGIQIASAVNRASKEVPVRPATQFHLAMFEAAASLGAPNGWPAKDKEPAICSEAAFDFLENEVRGRAVQLVTSGRRIPEEVVSHSLMRQLIRQ